ncbi:MAG: hypothetical protein ACPGYT_09950 [Nitrospirales bacterium]
MKMLFLLVVFAVVFGLGYYTGQRPDEVKQKLRDLSGEVLEQTIGLDQGVSLQKEYLMAKERLLEGKSQFLNHQYESASNELGLAFEHLGKAKVGQEDKRNGKHIEEIMHEILQAQERLAEGEGVSREIFDKVQARLNDLLP